MSLWSRKPKFLRESMKQNGKFQGGGRVPTKKNHPLGRYQYFLKLHNLRVTTSVLRIDFSKAYSNQLNDE